MGAKLLAAAGAATAALEFPDPTDSVRAAAAIATELVAIHPIDPTAAIDIGTELGSIELVDPIDPAASIDAELGAIELINFLDSTAAIDVDVIDFICHIHPALEALPLQHCTGKLIFV